ncbi:MAG: MBL fold metallo-hydrolase [Abditibacteriales bacterium]|nr:MBL fold metallo-hydrolase [Abditibacteriales bacterium]MDW8365698.1 MBL fold metallo-hydrolase [Abditibacteriales bacterium]
MELLPGLHQIRGTLGPRHFFQYLLVGEWLMLVDTGINTTPQDTIFPYMQSVGLEPSDIDFCLITHADVDHFGGNVAIRQVADGCVFCAHELDAPWIQSREAILTERYSWYEAHGITYPAEVKQWLQDALGPDMRLDLLLQGNEILHLADDRPLRMLHLPGHSPGHLGLYDAANKAAVITDAVLGRGLLDVQGNLISPPPYFEVEPYLWTIETLESLEIDHLLTAHYAPLQGEAVARFLQESRAFVQELGETVAHIVEHAEEPLTLKDITQEADARVGPFTAFANELAGPVHAHLRQLVEQGQVVEDTRDGAVAWRWR